jgi:ribonuclease P protein component
LAAPEPTLPISTLISRREFLRAKSGRKLYTPLVSIQMIAGPEPHAMRVGYTVSKHCGNAVLRNKIKRRLRMLVQEIWPTHAMAGHDYVLIARKGADCCDFAELRSALITALGKVKRA